MRIEELIIDGFKSYPVRTHVSGFDPSFNAITGLNGSGKSNILDAICFVLGITNLSAVRANNLQDLIYKRGQAGVTKASVTIVFDNSDRATSPVSFENYAQITVTRQVAMGGLSKYLINGHKATLQAVQNMFQSVQLNINNPNFLIMQGKITKVLNMKPAEILSMIEEAAGTRMFEDRKEKAIKTMSKKDQKVKEINALLTEEITPKLDKLREEKRSFLEYQKISSELDRLTRLAKAWEWKTLRARLEERRTTLAQKQKQRRVEEKEASDLKRQISSIEKELETIEKRREMELNKGGKLKCLMQRSKALSDELVKVKTGINFKISALEEEEKRMIASEKALTDVKAFRMAKGKEHEKVIAAFADFKKAHEAALDEISKEEELLQTLTTGMAAKASAGDKGGGYMGRLADAHARDAAADNEMQHSNMRIDHMQNQVKISEQTLVQARKESSGLVQQLEVAKAKVDQLQAKITATGYDDQKSRALRQRRSELASKLDNLSERRDAIASRLSALDFTYSDPTPDFDRSKVKGLIANLIQLDPGKAHFSTALEVCAGGRLYNVVVEDEMTGGQLLANGKLRKRVTILPLNKISAFVASAAKVGAAQKLAPGKVDLALSLIGYGEEVTTAMQYVFGSTLICADAATAKRVTFDGAVKLKSVTLDGDVYDPAGTLSGGSKSSMGGIFVKAQELNNVQNELQAVKRELKTCETELAAEVAKSEALAPALLELQTKSREVTLLDNQLQGSTAARLEGEVKTARESIDELKKIVEAAKEKKRKALEEITFYEKEIEEFGSDKQSKLEELQKRIKDRKATVQKTASEIKARQNQVRTLALELDVGAGEIASTEAEIEMQRKMVAKAAAELETHKAQTAEMQAEVDKLEEQLFEERAAQSASDDELNVLRNAVKKKRQGIADADLTVKQLQHEVERLEADYATAEKGIDQLEQQFGWIQTDKELFGTPGGAYDFKKYNMKEVARDCHKLEERQHGLQKKVNPKVMNMIDSVEKKEQSLKQMMSTILKDKDKIEDTIQELDCYKKEALEKTWRKVNGDFGDIFAELLPGNFAKLQPPEGQELTQGLEVKVRLGTVWKQSLTELSGGQRSLIALSLIMSLLQFKPAPMYILDEIDAALDLSHTQHIGQLFKSRFSGSQFIVVSLKEGLFTNANVLFRARFRDGTSVVERLTQKGGMPLEQSNDKENAPPGGTARPNVGGKVAAATAFRARAAAVA
ncbi:RecF/RecN/SMC protein [Tilletiaria anomala UBC 951]|uniref:Structural maintenance of chromosomes protein n=1 Tax=Tilletiaria anomala (strain ATCC 24038 / CBS 436.72 / UBC 951) TaxID=1037660 RepID=A0A066VMT4_TILAU|nr:RecF/RecN/SMC protein [Tilletiaria anomala UBC 951]KDN40089.1 RecF/RecN/SMC protein [Tilletiaria anomala UBC 951]